MHNITSDTKYNIICGILLGGASISKLSPRLSINQKPFNKEYLLHLQEFIESTIKDYSRYTLLYTPSNDLFKEMRKEWYPNDSKRVPLNLKLNWEIINHWVCCDGMNLQSRKQYILNSKFDEGSCSVLTNQLSNLGIDSFISLKNKKAVITISAKSYLYFINNLNIPFECFKHKVDVTKAAISKPNFGCNKLSYKHAQQIRSIYFNGNITYDVLSKKYKVSKQTIYNIINNLTYKNISDFSIKGSCEVKTSW